MDEVTEGGWRLAGASWAWEKGGPILRNPDAQDRQGTAGIEAGTLGGMIAGPGWEVSGFS